MGIQKEEPLENSNLKFLETLGITNDDIYFVRLKNGTDLVSYIAIQQGAVADKDTNSDPVVEIDAILLARPYRILYLQSMRTDLDFVLSVIPWIHPSLTNDLMFKITTEDIQTMATASTGLKGQYLREMQMYDGLPEADDPDEGEDPEDSGDEPMPDPEEDDTGLQNAPRIQSSVQVLANLTDYHITTEDKKRISPVNYIIPTRSRLN